VVVIGIVCVVSGYSETQIYYSKIYSNVYIGIIEYRYYKILDPSIEYAAFLISLFLNT